MDCNDIKVSAERKPYASPNITINPITINSHDDLERLTDILIKEESIYGDNCYDKNITTSISYDYSIEKIISIRLSLT